MIRLYAEIEECAEIEEHVEATVALVQRLGCEFEQRGMAGFGAGVTTERSGDGPITGE